MRIGENARIFFSEREKSVPAMRVTTLVNKLIGLQGLWVRGFHFQADKARVVIFFFFLFFLCVFAPLRLCVTLFLFLICSKTWSYAFLIFDLLQNVERASVLVFGFCPCVL